MVNAILPHPELLREIENDPELTTEQKEHLADVAQRLTVLLEPLAQITSSDDLRNTLEKVTISYSKLTFGLLNILLPTFPMQNLTGLFQRVNTKMAELASKKTGLLGKESLQQFIMMGDSLWDFTEWAVDKTTRGGLEAIKVQTVDPIVGPTLLRAAILWTTVSLILIGALPHRRKKTINLLCATADRYLAQAEEDFDDIRLIDPRPEGSDFPFNNPELEASYKEAIEDVASGRVYRFSNIEEALAWLHRSRDSDT